MPRIVINNFSCIKHLDIEIPRCLVFIGESGTGKSVAAKLIGFFEEFFSSFYYRYNVSNKSISASIESDFKKRFHVGNDLKASIKYYFNKNEFVNIVIINGDVDVKFSKSFQQVLIKPLELLREKIDELEEKEGDYISRIDSYQLIP